MRYLLLALLAALWGCSASRAVRPLGEGRTAAGVSLGGPVFTSLGAPVPAPLTSAYVRHGLTERTDIDGGLHAPISAAMGLDLGLSHQVLAPDGAIPAVQLGARGYLFWNALRLAGRTDPVTGAGYPWGPRVFEDAYGLASWQPAQPVLLWTGLELLAQVEAGHFDPAAIVGAEWRPVRRLGLQLEVKDALPLSNARPLVVEYLGVAGPDSYGALIVQLGVNAYFGGEP